MQKGFSRDSAVRSRVDVLLSLFPEAGAFEVACRRVVEVGQAPANFEYELADTSHLFVIDLLWRIGHAMVVGMESRGEEDDGNTFRRVAVVVAAIVNPLRVGRIVELEIQ